MINCSCLVQEGQAPDLNKEEIQGSIRGFIAESFGEEAQITWGVVGSGDGFTAGKASTSSVVSIAVQEPLSQRRRENLLRQFVDLWISKTGNSVDEIVIAIADPLQN